MSRQFFLIVAVVTLAGICASGQTAAQTAPNVGPFGGAILTTPTATLSSPAPTAGISDAGRAGISANTPVNSGVQSNPENYTNGAAVNSGVNISAGGTVPERATNDMGPSFYSDGVGGSANGPSVAEVAAQLKSSKMNARVLTNDDVQKMVADKTGVTMAKNMPPLGPGATPQSGATSQASAQSAQGNSSTAQPGQAGAAESQSSSAEPAGGTATTPQINQNQQSNDAQGRSKLPATSTLLPLFGLLGLVSGGLGFLMRKMRK
ncbi:MAG TPA: hypothetical protein VFR84_18800 [Candidatus Angelobacter sp.]|nr:hypothetical protein [Candidatus Angelobacter sp.]